MPVLEKCSNRDGVGEKVEQEKVEHVSYAVSLFFGAVFSAIAAILCFKVYQQIFDPDADLFAVSLLTLAALLFSFIGILILFGVVFWSKYKNAKETYTSLQVQWDNGRIICSNKVFFQFYFGLLVLLVLILTPSYYMLYMDFAAERYTRSWWLISIIPFVYLSFKTVRSYMRYKKYGDSICELTKGPGQIGEEISLRIIATSRVNTSGDFKGMLSCKQLTKTGTSISKTKKSTYREDILWQEEQTVPHQTSRAVFGINFTFKIPDNLPPADLAGAHAKVKWIFNISAATEGIDYYAQFQLPVFARK